MEMGQGKEPDMKRSETGCERIEERNSVVKVLLHPISRWTIKWMLEV